LIDIERQTGTTPQQLKDAPDIPDGVGYLWGVFFEIKRAGEPVSFSSINDWSSASGIALTYYEADILRGIDRVIMG